MRRSIIVSGGDIDFDFALSFLNEKAYSFLIGADRGIHFLRKAGKIPTHIVGDFDSSTEGDLEYFKENVQVPVYTYPSEKDETDTQIAVELAIELKSDEIYILGGTGSRVDHLLSNIRVLAIPERKGIPCFLADPWNRIRVIDKPLILSRQELIGQYVSLFALGGQVEGLTLTGFKYPLVDYELTGDNPMGVSNEIKGEKAEIFFRKGLLVVAESRDSAVCGEPCR